MVEPSKPGTKILDLAKTFFKGVIRGLLSGQDQEIPWTPAPGKIEPSHTSSRSRELEHVTSLPKALENKSD